jgi:hypothetical protein
VAKFGDLELEVLDLRIEIAGAGLGLGGAPVLFDKASPLAKQSRQEAVLDRRPCASQ